MNKLALALLLVLPLGASAPQKKTQEKKTIKRYFNISTHPFIATEQQEQKPKPQRTRNYKKYRCPFNSPEPKMTLFTMPFPEIVIEAVLLDEKK